MKNLNYKWIVLSVAVTAIVLFGGWYAFQFFNTDKPINDWVQAREGMHIENIHTIRDTVQVEVQFSERPNFGQDYLEFRDFLEQTLSGKKSLIYVSPEQGEYHPFWLEQAPALLEAFAQQHYTTMIEHLRGLEDVGLLEEGRVQLNSERMFIYMRLATEQPVAEGIAQQHNEIYITLPLRSPDERGDV